MIYEKGWKCEECGLIFRWFVQVTPEEAKKVLTEKEYKRYEEMYLHEDEEAYWLVKPSKVKSKTPELFCTDEGVEWWADDSIDICEKCLKKVEKCHTKQGDGTK